MNDIRNTRGSIQSFAALAAAAAAIWAAVEIRTVSRELHEVRSEVLTTNFNELRAEMHARFDELWIDLDQQVQVSNALFTEVRGQLDSLANRTGNEQR